MKTQYFLTAYLIVTVEQCAKMVLHSNPVNSDSKSDVNDAFDSEGNKCEDDSQNISSQKLLAKQVLRSLITVTHFICIDI